MSFLVDGADEDAVRIFGVHGHDALIPAVDARLEPVDHHVIRASQVQAALLLGDGAGAQPAAMQRAAQTPNKLQVFFI